MSNEKVGSKEDHFNLAASANDKTRRDLHIQLNFSFGKSSTLQSEHDFAYFDL
jgi:hypothetical protein